MRPILTYELLSITRNFNINVDIDRFYFPHKEVACSLKSILMSYEACSVTLEQYLQQRKETSHHLIQICYNEIHIRITRRGGMKYELIQIVSPRSIGNINLSEQQYKKMDQFTERIIHGYLAYETQITKGLIMSTAWHGVPAIL